MSMLPTLGPAHFSDCFTDWKIICGADGDEILFDRYSVATTENKKYVTCQKCLEALKKQE